MRRRDVKPGQAVQTATTSGQPIDCVVVEATGWGEWYLDSPEHGRQIVRSHRELQPQTAKEQ